MKPVISVISYSSRPSDSHGLTVRLTIWDANSRSHAHGFASKSHGESENLEIAKQFRKVWRDVEKLIWEENLGTMPAWFQWNISALRSLGNLKFRTQISKSLLVVQYSRVKQNLKMTQQISTVKKRKTAALGAAKYRTRFKSEWSLVSLINSSVSHIDDLRVFMNQFKRYWYFSYKWNKTWCDH